MYAFVATANDGGDEGIIAVGMPGNPTTMLPLVGADMARVESLKKLADELGIEYVIKRFVLE